MRLSHRCLRHGARLRLGKPGHRDRRSRRHIPTTSRGRLNIAIGQGGTLVTHQVAQLIAAVNSSTSTARRSSSRSSPSTQRPRLHLHQVNGTLPVSEENLQIIQAAMYTVANNQRGTAYYAIPNVKGYQVYSKTGTAESGSGESHAWFAGYTDAGMANRPDIAVVVFVENGGEGSEVAAPIFQRVPKPTSWAVSKPATPGSKHRLPAHRKPRRPSPTLRRPRAVNSSYTIY
jgi:penicillin-binding protein 2